MLTISEEGKGRRSRIDDYRITKRGGLGIRNYSNGNVAGIKIVDDTDDLILISQNGILIRIHCGRTSTSRAATAAVSASCAWSRTTRWPWSPAWIATTTPRPQKIEDTGETDPTPEELAAIEAEELAQEAAEDAAPENDTEE